MCGIVYAQSLNGRSVNSLVLDQYEKQKLRGQQGFGVFNGKYTVKAAMEKRIKRWLKKDANASEMLLFHHRFPTSTENVKRAAHPFNTGDFFGDTRYVLVHNGVVRNPKDLREAHEKLGIEYQSVLDNGKFNDSEALMWDFALTMEGRQDDLAAYGGIAFICIKLENNIPTRMFFGRNFGRPLNLYRDKNGILLSSEGAGEEIGVNKLYTYNYQLNRLTDKHFRIPSMNPSYVSNWDSTRSQYVPKYNETLNPNSRNYIPASRKNYPYAQPSCYSYNEDDEDFELDADFQQDIYEYWDEESRCWVNTSSQDEYLDQRYGVGQFAKNKETKEPTLISDIITSVKPSKEEILNKFFELLAYSDGNFDEAYWEGQQRYYKLEGMEYKTPKDKRDMQVLHEACTRILEDPGYMNKDDYHSLWTKPGDRKDNKKDVPFTSGSDEDSVLRQVLLRSVT